MSTFQTTPTPIRSCSKGDVHLVWNVVRGKAFVTVPDTTISLKLDVLTLSGLQQIELNRFDAATRGIVWEEQAPSRDQRKVVNQYLKFLSKMWEGDKNEAPKAPPAFSRDPHRQTGQQPQNMIPIQPVPIQPAPIHVPQVALSAPIPIPGPLAIQITNGHTPPPSYQVAVQASALEATLRNTEQGKTPGSAPQAPKPIIIEPLKKFLKRRYFDGKPSDEWEVCAKAKHPRNGEVPETPANSPTGLIIDINASITGVNTEKPMET